MYRLGERARAFRKVTPSGAYKSLLGFGAEPAESGSRRDRAVCADLCRTAKCHPPTRETVRRRKSDRTVPGGGRPAGRLMSRYRRPQTIRNIAGHSLVLARTGGATINNRTVRVPLRCVPVDGGGGRGPGRQSGFFRDFVALVRGDHGRCGRSSGQCTAARRGVDHGRPRKSVSGKNTVFCLPCRTTRTGAGNPEFRS